jgi:hypothetical protein
MTKGTEWLIDTQLVTAHGNGQKFIFSSTGPTYIKQITFFFQLWVQNIQQNVLTG